MSEFKGTKGKWTIDTEYKSVYSEYESDIIEGNIICDAPFDWGLSMQNWEANAKLIVCAPLMLGMLIRIKRYQTREDEYAIENLIKKATE